MRTFTLRDLAIIYHAVHTKTPRSIIPALRQSLYESIRALVIHEAVSRGQASNTSAEALYDHFKEDPVLQTTNHALDKLVPALRSFGYGLDAYTPTPRRRGSWELYESVTGSVHFGTNGAYIERDIGEKVFLDPLLERFEGMVICLSVEYEKG